MNSCSHVWHCRHTNVPRCACCDAASWTRQSTCASPPSPRHAQPDWMGGGLVSRQMMHAPASVAMSGQGKASGTGARIKLFRFWTNGAGLRADPLAKCPEKIHRPALRVSRGQGRSRRRNETRLGEDTLRSHAIGVVAAASLRSATTVQVSFEQQSLCTAQDESLRPGMRRLGFAFLAVRSRAIPDAPNGSPGCQSSIVVGGPPPGSARPGLEVPPDLRSPWYTIGVPLTGHWESAGCRSGCCVL